MVGYHDWPLEGGILSEVRVQTIEYYFLVSHSRKKKYKVDSLGGMKMFLPRIR